MSEVFQGRFPIDLANKYIKTIASGSDTGPYTRTNGLKIDSTGAVVIVGSAASIYRDGLAFDTNDNLLITSSPATPTFSHNGMLIDSNGCICATTAPASPSVYQNGLLVDANGYLSVSNIAAGGPQGITTDAGVQIQTDAGVNITTSS